MTDLTVDTEERKLNESYLYFNNSVLYMNRLRGIIVKMRASMRLVFFKIISFTFRIDPF